jgi:hypothetical protein
MRGDSLLLQVHNFEFMGAEQPTHIKLSRLIVENKQVVYSKFQNRRLWINPQKEGLLLGRSVIRRHREVTIITYRSEMVRHPNKGWSGALGAL